MTEAELPEGVTDDQRASIAAAEAARQAAERELVELRHQTRRELVPLWRRLAEPKPDSFGLELEVSLIPRGAR